MDTDQKLNSLIDGIDHLYIHSESLNDPVSVRLRSLFPKEKVSVTDNPPMDLNPGKLSANEFNQSKKNLWVQRHKGRFFKQCPGAKPGLVCCNYFVLNLGLQCNMNCSYCYLQSYINTPLMTVYSNISEALDELKVLADAHPEKPYRVGTGETIDSLSLDPLTLYSHELMEFFRSYPGWILEMKTKSDNVDQFLDQQHDGNIQIAWSVNPEFIVKREEHGTASLERRIAAARRCRDKGFKVAFHIDPIIWHEDWKKNYLELVDQITSEFKPTEIPHISLGTLRFKPEQKDMMRERFGMKSLVTSAEMFNSRDGKMRYDKSLRHEMFTTIMAAFREKDPAWRVALCMETPEAWATTIGGSPRKDQSIEELFRPLPKKAPIKAPEPKTL